MILDRLARCAFCVTLGLMAVPASADVMEIGTDGARWIAGGQVAAPVMELASPAMAVAPEIVPEEVWQPEHVVADTGQHGAYVPAQYSAKIQELARRFDLSPALLEAVVWQESRWNANARSPVGARGLAQLMPGTARYLGVDPNDPYANLEGGARYLREQLDLFDGDLEKALAAYNAGPNRVLKAGGVPNIRETKQYVAAIMGRLSNYSRSN